MIDKYQLGNNIDTSAVREKAKWSVIGYASDKENSLSDILSWYSSLKESGYEDIYKYTERIKSLSNKMEELGDNRLEYQANCRLYGDLFSGGLTTIKKVLLTPVYMSELLKEPGYIIEGLIGFLENAEVSENDMLSIWAFGLGILNWKNEADHSVIAALDKALEICAARNKIISAYEKMHKMGKAEINVRVDSQRYIIPDRWCDNAEKEKQEKISTNYIEQYLQADELDYRDRQKIIKECELVRKEQKSYYLCIEKILEKELANERYSWRENELLKYAINNLPNSISDNYISSYFISCLEGKRKRFYPGESLNFLCLWKTKQSGQEYCRQSLDNLLNTHEVWISSAERISLCKENANINSDAELQRIYSFLNIESVASAEDLFIRILMLFMLSDNADTVENALRGIFHLVQVHSELVMKLEEYWTQFHYRAKEWVLMIYELLMKTTMMDNEMMENLVTKHINDLDFNVAFYSRMILKMLCDRNGFELPREKQKYFMDIPEYSTKKLLSVKSKEQCLNNTRYVMKMIARIEEETEEDCYDIEEKTALYRERITNTKNLLFNVGSSKQCQVALDDINVAFFRVLYKEWYQGRWDGKEVSLGRVILSASEPYVLLQSPAIWPYQEGWLLNMSIDEFEMQGEECKEEILKNIFCKGLSDQEITLGGALTEYNHKKELTGFLTTYIDFPTIKRTDALYARERNIRFLIYRSNEFAEEKNSNLLIYNTGVASFKGSMCMFSQRALNYFGWELIFDDGLKIIDSKNNRIGRFEYYYGLRNIGNNVYMNQPIIQRWVITKEAFAEIKNMLTYNLKQVANATVTEVIL